MTPYDTSADRSGVDTYDTDRLVVDESATADGRRLLYFSFPDHVEHRPDDPTSLGGRE